MFGAFLGQQVGVGVPRRPRDLRIALPLELNQVLALEEVIQIAGREDETTVNALHRYLQNDEPGLCGP